MIHLLNRACSRPPTSRTPHVHFTQGALLKGVQIFNDRMLSRRRAEGSLHVLPKSLSTGPYCKTTRNTLLGVPMTSYKHPCSTENNNDVNDLRKSRNMAVEILSKLLAVSSKSNSCDESQLPRKCRKSAVCSIGGTALQKAEKRSFVDGVDRSEGRAW